MASKGSEWRKWDLHFHTPSSYDYVDTSVTNQQIIDGLVSHNVAVVAITDHHVIDVERITELQKLGKPKGITVLPGIEFLSDARGNEPIHFIAIFSENSNLNYIWKQIESKTNIHQIEKDSKARNEVYCDLIDTINLVKNELGGLITIHAGTKSNGIDNITNSLPQAIAQKQDIAEAIDIFEMGKEGDCEGYNKHVIPFLKNKFGKHIPMIMCSDNHNIKSYSVKQNLWIKSEPTFEGLKQVLYEPEHRVKIQKDEPDFKEGKLVIDEVQFFSTDNKFTSKPIKLNKNLNVIIGGKSSGKSILLFNIAQTLLADKDLFSSGKFEDKYMLRAQDASFNFQVKTLGGFTQLMHREFNENSIIPEVKYIPQNYLVDLAEPKINKTGNQLNKIVRGLINEDDESNNEYDNFLTTVIANDKKREAIIDNYFDIKRKIADLEELLKTKGNIDILKGNIESNLLRVEDLNKDTGLDEKQIQEYNDIRKKLDTVTLERSKAVNDFNKARQFNTESLSQLNALKNKKNLVSSSFEENKIGLHFDAAYSRLDSLITDLNEFSSKFSLDEHNKLVKQSEISEVFKEIDTRRDTYKQQLEPYERNEAIKKQIEQIMLSVNTDRIALQTISQLNREISDNKTALENEKSKLFNFYLENYKCYTEIIEKLKNRTVSLEGDGLLIKGKACFNFEKFRKAVYSVSDGRSASYNQYDICKERDSLSDYNLDELLDDLKNIFKSIVETESYVLTSKSEKKHAIKLLFDDYFFDYWLIEYKNDRLGKMSTGKASFVILMLIIGLSKSKAPILIDQPEDNLDNRSITSDLVDYLRKKKIERQIILVTHNANIVVNADSENIIIANQRGQGNIDTTSPYQFDYINGALENTFPKNEHETDLLKSMGIREHIADIVEGGKDAFKKRERKYNFD